MLDPHRTAVREQRMKGVVADPCLVPEDVIAEAPNPLEHRGHAADRPIAGRQLQARETKWTWGPVELRVPHERVAADLLAQPRLVPSVPLDGSDHAERIARR